MPSFPPGEFKHSWGTAEKLYKSEVIRLKKRAEGDLFVATVGCCVANGT
jgi:hypothetical protein